MNASGTPSARGTTLRERPNQLGLIKRRAWKMFRGDDPRLQEPAALEKPGSKYVVTADQIRAGLAGLRDAIEALLAGEYADRVSGDGIRLERCILLAVADKR